jgi:hypothetical protein
MELTLQKKIFARYAKPDVLPCHLGVFTSVKKDGN